MRYLLIALLLVAQPALATIYKWTDQYGNTVFGDNPPDKSKATPVDLPPITTVPALPASEQGSQGSAPPASPTSKTEATTYKSLEVTHPKNDSAFWDGAGNVEINVTLEPALNIRVGDQIELYLDGKLVNKGSNTTYTVTNVDRGTHTVHAEVVDAKGDSLLKSSTVTFTLHRHSILHPKPKTGPM
ncbi:MAG: DUF4124 domain-containing protein [Gammaproteobacteria bacterium]|jgi:hypothetical protein